MFLGRVLEAGIQRYEVVIPVAATALFLSLQLGKVFLSPSSRLPKDTPIFGVEPGQWFFPLTRARVRNAIYLKSSLVSMYQNMRDMTSIFPVIAVGDLVFLPFREMQWLADQPESAASGHELLADFLETDYTIPGSKLAHDNLHVQVIATKLTRETANLIPDIYEECQLAVDELWGLDVDERHVVDVMPTVQHMIAQINSRAFFGTPICMNKKLQDLVIAFTNDVTVSAMILRLIWSPLRPLLAPIVTLPNRLHLNQFYRIIQSEIDRRLFLYDTLQNNSDEKVEEPNDFLQWSIQQAKALGDPHHYDPFVLARRLMVVNFSSVHTSSLVVTNALLDLTKNSEHVNELRREIVEVLEQHGGEWNKTALAEMPKLDSAMRESQRLNNGNFVAVIRKVVSVDGITTPSGFHLPYGTIIGGPSYAVHRDENIYPEAEEYRPFRFSDMGIAIQNKQREKDQDGKAETSTGKRTRYAWVTSSPEYTAFGHGRYACPGRFFAATGLKILLGYLLLHYDIEPLPQPPNDLWRMGAQIAGLRPQFKVRRRKF